MIAEHPLLDRILVEHADRGRDDPSGWAGYRSHAYRVLNYVAATAPADPDRDDKAAIAAAFHDLELFHGLDYLGPSIDAMVAWTSANGYGDWQPEIARMIAFHHRWRPYRGPYAELVEPFRRADWNEVLLGTLALGVPRDVMREVRAAFPLGTFYSRTIIRAFLRWGVRHPLSPPPVFRGRRALRGRPGEGP